MPYGNDGKVEYIGVNKKNQSLPEHEYPTIPNKEVEFLTPTKNLDHFESNHKNMMTNTGSWDEQDPGKAGLDGFKQDTKPDVGTTLGSHGDFVHPTGGDDTKTERLRQL